MGAHRSSFEQKVQWLVDHPELCRAWPNPPATDAAIVTLMKDAGLISWGAHNYDIGDFGKAVAEARARLRKARRCI